MQPFEVIVIGAGPAGAVAARDLCRAGARVALVDGSHPREKPCGGGVTGRALELGFSGTKELDRGRAGQAPGRSRSIETVRFETARAGTQVDLPPDYLEVFSREGFDAALLNAAVEAGAVPVAARATAVARDGGAWTVATGAGPITGRWLLAADGAGGMLRRKLAKPFGRAQLSIAAGSYVAGIDSSEVVIRFVDEPRGYLWSFPRPGHLAVGTCAQADATSTAEMHAITDRWLDGYAPAAGRPRTRYAWPIPSLSAADFDAERPAGDGWMLLGDAAGLVDPLTREGIYFALRSGILAAQAIAGADPSRAYTVWVREELYSELRRAARFKAGFFRPRFTALLLHALERSPAIRDIMVDLVAGRQPYRGLKRRLLGTMELGLALQLVRRT